MIVFPFKAAYLNKNGNITKEDKEYNSTHFLNDFFDTQVYISMKIGNPPQEVKVLLTSKYCAFKIGKSDHCIYSDEYLSYYNRNKSEDFKYTTLYNMTPSEFNNEKGYTAEDTIYAYTDLKLKDEKKFSNIGFFLGSDTDDKLCGIIGFKMDFYDFSCSKINNIIRSFKSTDIINNYNWMLKYNSIDEGYYIIGSEFSELMNNYDEKKIFRKESFMYAGAYPWGFHIKEIKCGKQREILSRDEKRLEIENDLSIIIGSETYYKYINSTFFAQYNCSRNIWSHNQYYKYYVIECNKEHFGKNELMEFPELIFDPKEPEFKGELILDYNDLFTETKYKYFFNVIFHEFQNEIWVLGKIFLKKYPVMYNLDNRMIEIYDDNKNGNNNGDNNNEENENGKNNYNQTSKGKTIIYIVIIIILVIITGIAGYMIGKQLNQIRKRRANELADDDYDYVQEKEQEQEQEQKDKDLIEDNSKKDGNSFKIN